MNTDRELLELAARAASMDAQWDCPERGMLVLAPSGIDTMSWNPLVDDGDAFRLAVKLNLIPTHDPMLHMAWVNGTDGEIYGEATYKECDLCEYAATRRAIVRAAAAIGQSIKEQGK